MLGAVLASPVAAQTLQPGQVILLRSSAGQYLSAHDVTSLVYLSPNAAAWEQWQYVMDYAGPRLISFHGTSLVAQPGAVAQIPSVDSDKYLSLSKVVRIDRGRGLNWHFENSPPANGDSLRREHGGSELSQQLLVRRGDGALRRRRADPCS